MPANPLIERYRLGLRSPQFWLYSGLYIVVLGIIISTNLALYYYQHVFDDFTGICRSLYFQLLVVLGIILYGWTAYNSGSTLSGDVSRKTYDFFRLLPLPATQKAVGIVIGRNLAPLLFAGATCVFLLVFGHFGEIKRALCGQTLFVVFVTSTLLNLTLLLGSSQPHKGRRHPFAMIMILLALISPVVLFFIGVLSESDQQMSLDKFLVSFYLLHVPLLILVGLIALYMSIWVFTGIVRKLTLEEHPLFSDMGAPSFVFGYCAVVLGLFWSCILSGDNSVGVLVGFWFAAFLPLTFVPFGSLRSFNSYLEYTREIQHTKTSQAGLTVKLFLRSNVFLGFVIFAVYTVYGEAVGLMAGFGEMTTLHQLAVIFSFYAFLILLLETGVMYKPLFARIDIVLGTIVFLYFAWPIFALAIMSEKLLFAYGPIGIFVTLAIGDPTGVKFLDNVLLVNLLLCIVPLRLIWKRYRHLLSVRQKM